MKTKLLKIAYSHNADTNDYVVFKKVSNQDHEIHTCNTQEQAEQWLEDNFVCVRTGVDYNLYLPFELDNQLINRSCQ